MTHIIDTPGYLADCLQARLGLNHLGKRPTRGVYFSLRFTEVASSGAFALFPCVSAQTMLDHVYLIINAK